MSHETVMAELEDATRRLRDLRLELHAVAQRSGTFDYEAQEMDAEIERIRAVMLRFQLWLVEVGKETR